MNRCRQPHLTQPGQAGGHAVTRADIRHLGRQTDFDLTGLLFGGSPNRDARHLLYEIRTAARENVGMEIRPLRPVDGALPGKFRHVTILAPLPTAAGIRSVLPFAVSVLQVLARERVGESVANAAILRARQES